SAVRSSACGGSARHSTAAPSGSWSPIRPPGLDFPIRKPYARFPTRKVSLEMQNDITEADARAALAPVDQGHQHVIDDITIPSWYWWGLAIGWIVLGVITDLGHAWLTLVATLVFGAVHSYAFGRLSAGRQASSRVRVRSETAGWFAPVVILGSLLV